MYLNIQCNIITIVLITMALHFNLVYPCQLLMFNLVLCAYIFTNINIFNSILIKKSFID
jgi:hypothetical protein